MSERMREFHRKSSVRRVGGGLSRGADTNPGVVRRGRAVVRAVPLESESVSGMRSAKVRRYAVLSVALFVVAMAIRFIFLAPLPRP